MISKDLLDTYIEVEKLMRLYKAEEMKIRKQIVNKLKTTVDVDSGKGELSLDEHFIKFELVTNVTIEDKERLDFLYEDMSDEEKEIFKPTYTLSIGNYKKYKEKYKDEDTDVFDLVVEKEGAPKLKVETL